MTVRQSAQLSFDLQPQELAAGVRKVLDGHSIYRRSSERQSGSGAGIVFYTYVQPDIPLILGTDMYVSLEPIGSQTIVTVTVESQPYIFGDAFGFYDRYISTFFGRLNETLGGNIVGQPAQVAVGNPVYRRPGNVWSVVALGAILLVYLLLLFQFSPNSLFAHPNTVSWVLLVGFVIVLASFIRSLFNLLRPR